MWSGPGADAGERGRQGPWAPQARNAAFWALRETGPQTEEGLLAQVGHCGAAQPLLMLVRALQEAKPGDTLLLGAYADGADTLVFRVTDQIQTLNRECTPDSQLARKLELSSYAKSLSYEGIVEPLPGEPFRLFPSATVTWRDRNSILRCHGSKGRKCGTAAFPNTAGLQQLPLQG